MKLEENMLAQLRSLFAVLEHNYKFIIELRGDEPSQGLREMMEGLVSTSPLFSLEVKEGSLLRMTIEKDGKETSLSFRGVPSGHEFNSLLIAIFNLDGKGKTLPDETLIRRIQALKGEHLISTYVSLSCTNCPDVVQALNQIAIYNPNIRHEMVDGALYQSEVDGLGIAAVPAVVEAGELIHVGKSSLGELLMELEKRYGAEPLSMEGQEAMQFDQVVIGGGPAGITSAIYSARKGLNVAIVADRVGGQVNETTAIENISSVLETTGTRLSADLRSHAEKYQVTILEGRKVEEINKLEKGFSLKTSLGEEVLTDQVILATGASWRKLGVPGEEELIGRGVAFCPHCDGPFFKDREIAVIGGGNSGIEAAIDLAGICKKVTVIEYADSFKADQVLQDKLRSLGNVDIRLATKTLEVIGDGKQVTALAVTPRDGGDTEEIKLNGVFVQIGLVPNTKAFAELVELNRMGEIVVDSHNRTSVAGIYAAGDCTTVPYKQIVIAMGEGAKASLAAFDDRMRS